MASRTHYDYLIVGTGLFGATCANFALQNGKSVLMIDKRSHIGGNVYTEDVDGIPVHKYGAHIFHTDKKWVWDFVCEKCGEMQPFINSPIANYKGELYNLPFNMNTFNKMWGVVTPEDAKKMIDAQKSVAPECPKNLEDQAISLVGTDIYTKLIKDYTEKQWGRSCTELDPSIIKRIPVRFTYNNNYFNDPYQGIPKGGYNKLIENLIGNADVMLNTPYDKSLNTLADTVIYTGPIDEYFDYCFGKLSWRTVRFETYKEFEQNFQGVAVMNYTSHDVPFTRRIEHKHFDPSCEGYDKALTVISDEYSCEWVDGMDPYYPVSNATNDELLKKYNELDSGNVIFGGRLGTYKYYDMDDTIINAANLMDTLLKGV